MKAQFFFRVSIEVKNRFMSRSKVKNRFVSQSKVKNRFKLQTTLKNNFNFQGGGGPRVHLSPPSRGGQGEREKRTREGDVELDDELVRGAAEHAFLRASHDGASGGSRPG